MNGYTVSLFTPTIVHDLGYSAANAQLLSVPPFACAGVSTLVICFYSDKANLRGRFILLCATISMIGYIIAYNTSQPGPGYVATVFAASGAYPNIPLVLAWAGGNSGGNTTKRGVVLAIVIGFGNLGGCVIHLGPNFVVWGCWGRSQLGRRTAGSVPHSSIINRHVSILATAQYSVFLVCGMLWKIIARKYAKPFIRVMGSIVCTCIMMWTYTRLNKEKEELCAREGINEDMAGMYRDLADKSPLFR